MDLTLHARTGDCRIIVGAARDRLGALCAGRQVVVVTDGNVRRLHPSALPAGEVVEIGTGEGIKTLETVAGVYDRFSRLGLSRDGLVVGFGGGIVCDVAAFAAATWLRGVEVGLVPTTVLAQADAGVGGKNGVNFQGVKNLVGTIRQPRFVLADPSLLATLPPAEVRNGLAEVVKAAAIADAGFFELVEGQASSLLALELAVVEQAVTHALAVKVRIVEADELETGERRKLNFGHTIGHGYEALLGVRHGEAVAAGMAFAARLSEARGLLGTGGAARLERLLVALGLPTRFECDRQRLLDLVRHDKKRAGETVQMALLRAWAKR
jgi:3-dehydroquinate synthase